MKKILIVDDEESIQFLFSRIFKKEISNETYDLLYANGAESAIDIIKEESSLDLIISDINMPGMNGLELLKYVKENFNEIPVFMASAYTDNNRKEIAKELGALEYISKPIDFKLLKEKIIDLFS